MNKHVKEDDIDKFLGEHSDLFDSLANDIRCPVCTKFIKSPFYNLGPKYNSFEGCKECAEAVESKEDK